MGTQIIFYLVSMPGCSIIAEWTIYYALTTNHLSSLSEIQHLNVPGGI